MFPSMHIDEVTMSYIVFFFAAVPWCFTAIVIHFFLISLLYARCKLHHKSDPRDFMESLPGVSIIKPLMGVDPFLESNLESHFTLQYPQFELLLCVQDDQDPALQLVDKLRQRHPKVDCRIFIGGKDGIINPMVHNMAPAYDHAKYDAIWISTSRIWATTDIVMDMVAKMHDPRVALVHQMPFTTDQKGLAAAVEKVYFGCSVARYYQGTHVLGIVCFTGMSYMVKKHVLDELNGLGWFGRFLAEDHFLAKYLHERGYRHQIAAIPAQQNVANPSIVAYKDRMVRWLRLRLNMMVMVAALLEPMSESIPLGIYMSWSVYHFFEFNPYLYFVLHWVTWCALDYLQLRGVQHGSAPMSICTFATAWFIRETLYLVVFLEAIINPRRIKWGKRTYELSNFGETLNIVSDKNILPL